MTDLITEALCVAPLLMSVCKIVIKAATPQKINFYFTFAAAYIS